MADHQRHRDEGGQPGVGSDDAGIAVAEPIVRPKRRQKTEAQRERPKRQPRYHVILWDDDDHTFDYVIQMMLELFGHPESKGERIAEEVDLRGRAICLTTTLEHAELKRDQIHAYGREKDNPKSKGSMWASIEAER
jgi:ATP-dependent Clp protease adaptor protein ClpS